VSRVPSPFDPLRTLRVLDDHGVRFVLIGGFSARLHGSPTVTNDLDVCYARDRSNLEALANALVELHAKLRGAPEDVPFILDARTLAAGDHFTFVTDAGSLDILGTPSGVSGYDELARNADRMDLDGVSVLVASIDDLIRMKRASARPKDLIEVEVLGALREEVEAQDRDRRAARRARGRSH
jgi:hypothetical protein